MLAWKKGHNPVSGCPCESCFCVQASRSRLALGRSLPACSYLGFQNLALQRLRVRGVGSEGGVEWMSADVFLLLLGRFMGRKPAVAFLCLQTKGLWPCLDHCKSPFFPCFPHFFSCFFFPLPPQEPADEVLFLMVPSLFVCLPFFFPTRR